MTAREDAIKAGVQAYADMRQERLVLSDVEFVAAVVDAVEPILRERIANDGLSWVAVRERERLRAQVEAYFADAYSKARYRHANDPDHRHYWEGYRDALDIAEQAVLALLGGDS